MELHYATHTKSCCSVIFKYSDPLNCRVIIIDFRRDPRISSIWVMGHVRGNKAQVIQELHAAGFRLVDDKPLMRTNYFLEFIKSGKEKGVE